MTVVIDATVKLENKLVGDTKMTTLKGWITTTFLAVTLILSTMTANAGVIIGGADLTSTCSETTGKAVKVDYGVIIGGITGVIIGGFTGVIIGGLTSFDTTPTDCGVINEG